MMCSISCASSSEVPERVDLHNRDQPVAVRPADLCPRAWPAGERMRRSNNDGEMRRSGEPQALAPEQRRSREHLIDRRSISRGHTQVGWRLDGVRRLVRLGVDVHTVRCESTCQF